MKQLIDGIEYDTDQMLDLHVGTVARWMGDEIDLVTVYADQEGVLYVEECTPAGTAGPARRTLTRANPKVAAYLVGRFSLPQIYLRAEESAR